MAQTIKAVSFDVGETLVDETRQWGEWADVVGVPRLAFFGALGSLIERGEHHCPVIAWRVERPGLTPGREARGPAGGTMTTVDHNSSAVDDLEQVAISVSLTSEARSYLRRHDDLWPLVHEGAQVAHEIFGKAAIELGVEGDELVLSVQAESLEAAIEGRQHFLDRWWIPNADALDGRLWLDVL